MQRKLFNPLILFCVGIFFVSGIISADHAKAALPDGLTITPREINISTFFAGQELTITGNILSSEDILIEIIGKDSESTFDMKGRVGPVWMTIGNVELKNIPELYQILMPGGQGWDEKTNALGLGINNLKKRLKTSGSIDVPSNVFDMYANLKKQEGLYQQVSGAISYSPGTDGTKQFKAVCHIPDRIKIGTYEVKATTISNGAAGRQMKDSFSVGEVGFIKLVNHLALNRSLTYGVTAVVIALLAGLLMGVLFKQSGEAH